jgi:hypothetical protein
MVSDLTESEIMKMSIKDIISTLKIEEMRGHDLREIIDKVKYGINIKFDSRLIGDGRFFYEKSKSGLVIIQHPNRKAVSYKDFLDEIENRETLGRKVILDILFGQDRREVDDGN